MLDVGLFEAKSPGRISRSFIRRIRFFKYGYIGLLHVQFGNGIFFFKENPSVLRLQLKLGCGVDKQRQCQSFVRCEDYSR